MNGDGAIGGNGGLEGFRGAIVVFNVNGAGVASILLANIERQGNIFGVALNLEGGKYSGTGGNVLGVRGGGGDALDGARASFNVDYYVVVAGDRVGCNRARGCESQRGHGERQGKGASNSHNPLLHNE